MGAGMLIVRRRAWWPAPSPCCSEKTPTLAGWPYQQTREKRSPQGELHEFPRRNCMNSPGGTARFPQRELHEFPRGNCKVSPRGTAWIPQGESTKFPGEEGVCQERRLWDYFFLVCLHRKGEPPGWKNGSQEKLPFLSIWIIFPIAPPLPRYTVPKIVYFPRYKM